MILLPGRGLMPGALGSGPGSIDDVPASMLEFGEVAWWVNRKRSASQDEGGGVISQITDISGNARTIDQGTNGRRPTFSTVNGNVSWLFDGTDDMLGNDNLNTSFSVVVATVFVVATPTAIVTNNADMVRFAHADFDNQLSLRRNVAGLNIFYNAFTAGSDMNLGLAASFAAGATKYYIARVRASGGVGIDQCSARNSDGLTNAADGPTGPGNAIDKIYFGAGSNTGGAPWVGHLHEAGIILRHLSDAELVRADRYFRREWTLT